MPIYLTGKFFIETLLRRIGYEAICCGIDHRRTGRVDAVGIERQTGGNVKAVCTWIGNSPEIALVHYAQITDADMTAAAKNTVLSIAEKEVQNKVQNIAETTGKSKRTKLL